MLDSLPSAEEEEPGPKVTSGGGEEGEEEMEHPESSLPVAEEDVDTIVACLEEIHRLFAQPQYLIVSFTLSLRQFVGHCWIRLVVSYSFVALDLLGVHSSGFIVCFVLFFVFFSILQFVLQFIIDYNYL